MFFDKTKEAVTAMKATTLFRSVVLSLTTAFALFCTFLPCSSAYVVTSPKHASFAPKAPEYSPATGLKNDFYEWRGQKIRYQVAGPQDAEHSVVLVHGLFVNGDHWRKTLRGLADAGYRAYAIDLLGCGYSSKPHPNGEEAMRLNGENGRFISTTSNVDTPDVHWSITSANPVESANRKRISPVINDVVLGTPDGGERTRDVDLRHPLGSCYNFYTWAEQVADFTKDVVQKADLDAFEVEKRRGLNQETTKSCRAKKKQTKTTLVCNSKGALVSLQAALDTPDLFDGVFVLNPTFREMHPAEMQVPSVTLPVVNLIQKLLRKHGHGLYQAFTRPDRIRQLLKEPYAVTDAVDDDLVHALLNPLLLPNAADVVFDILSYGGGPLLEQQLQEMNARTLNGKGPDHPQVWMCFGDEDPWISSKRMERLAHQGSVDRVIRLGGLGHCPHDEAPEVVNSLLFTFLGQVKRITDGGSFTLARKRALSLQAALQS